MAGNLPGYILYICLCSLGDHFFDQGTANVYFTINLQEFRISYTINLGTGNEGNLYNTSKQYLHPNH